MRNLNSCCCWRCRLCPCKLRNKFPVNFWNRTILLCIPCILYNVSIQQHQCITIMYNVTYCIHYINILMLLCTDGIYYKTENRLASQGLCSTALVSKEDPYEQHIPTYDEIFRSCLHYSRPKSWTNFTSLQFLLNALPIWNSRLHAALPSMFIIARNCK